jgi:hypothetical protein
MDSAEPHTPNPEAEYQRRLEQLRAAKNLQQINDARLSFARFSLMFVGALLGVWLVVTRIHSIYWIAIPVLLFLICAVIHNRVLRELQRCQRAAAFYERGLARIRNQWVGKGQAGERFLDSKHPYARDLDLFGSGSVFELLCTARTRAGEQTLAQWLLARASQEEALSRQGAVKEMRDLLDFREGLALLSEGVDARGRPNALTAWAEERPEFVSVYLRFVLPVLALLWAFGLIVWAVWGSWYFAAAITALNAIVAQELRRRANDGVSKIEAAVRDVRLISAVLARLESASFSCERLVALQRSLRATGESASQSLARLGKLADSLESRRNLIVKGLDRFIFWTLQFTLAIEAWRKKHGSEVRIWLAALGEMEALSDLAGYSYEHPADVFPEFTTESPCFEAEGLSHPLMPETTAVRNDLSLSRERRLVIISGPNMAGKSTFVRAVGVNAVLAQCGAPVRASKLRISPLAVAASVCVLDSLQGGISRFYAEIIRLKLIMDMTKGPVPVLFLLDELLSGTNSHDRRVGAEAVVRGLFERNAVGLVTTHDLSLTEIVSILGDRAANVHFEDRLEDGKLRFDYHLAPGIVQTSNALDLMRSIGLDV